ncbi:hypothetical protein GOP47_0029076 [Adiantum capillus-veneris]|nr:hypothetical protein GOP47_0029076 [Adiantum capillus-veneris]
MRTLFLFHALLIALVPLLSHAPSRASSYGLATYYNDFDTWVQYVHDTCHPEQVEQEDDDEDSGDHLPARSDKYKDEVFSKWVKTCKKGKCYKNKDYPKKVKGYGAISKKFLPGRHLIVEEEEDAPKDGSGDFATVQAAIDSVPTDNTKRAIIYVKKGIYREKVLIPSSKPFITLKGENAALTYIQWGDIASTIGKNGKPLSTYGSASVAVEADDFIALDISFKNTAPAPESGAVGKQGVALRIQGDRAAFYRCSFYGAQDTLYDREGRHYYYKCYIEGSIDFIFGNARSLFVKCHIHSIATPWGSITAQKQMEPKENTGYSFAYCMVTGTGTIYLGRSWGPFSRVVYSFTYFDDIIRPEGWNDWNVPSNQKKVFYGEYRCYGPGANSSGRVKWSRQLTPQQAKPFLSTAFIDGKEWLTK